MFSCPPIPKYRQVIGTNIQKKNTIARELYTKQQEKTKT